MLAPPRLGFVRRHARVLRHFIDVNGSGPIDAIFEKNLQTPINGETEFFLFGELGVLLDDDEAMTLLIHGMEKPSFFNTLEKIKNRDIEVIQGSIRSLPYKDNTFDFVYSNSVIEQFPRDYMLPFEEAYRVTSNAAFFSEPFKEAEPNILRRLHLKNIDYFNASYHEVEKVGFSVRSFFVPTLQKFAFNTGNLVCEKQRRNV